MCAVVNYSRSVDQRYWFSLVLQMGCTVDECMRHWKTIRDWYVCELKWAKKSKSGDDASAVYTPTWSLFNVLSILMESVHHRQWVGSVYWIVSMHEFVHFPFIELIQTWKLKQKFHLLTRGTGLLMMVWLAMMTSISISTSRAQI